MLIKHTTTLSFLLSLLIITLTLPACTTDDDDTLSQAQIDATRSILSGDIVVSAHATVNGVDKTLLDSGAPAKFSLSPADPSTTIHLYQNNFQLGKMPFPISLGIDLTISPLLSLESGMFSESGWVRFHGRRGVISITGQLPATTVDTTQSGDGTTITGYVNINTREIQFNISYAMMNVEVAVPRQTIDPTRADNYEDEVRQYEDDLNQYKKDHHLE